MIFKLIKKIILLFKYPQLKISTTTNLSNHGQLKYGKGCIICKNGSIKINSLLKFGEDVFISDDVEINSNEIVIGDRTSIQKNTRLFGNITIGKDCIFAPNLYASSNYHKFNKIPEMTINEQDKLFNTLEDHKSIIIDDDCWIGINVVILPGVKIAKGTVIGANSVINKDTVPYSIVAGAPGKKIGSRLLFNPPKILTPSIEAIPYLYKGFNTASKFLQKYITLSDSAVVIALDNSNSLNHKLYLKIEGTQKIYYENKELKCVGNEITIQTKGEDFICLNFAEEDFLKIKILSISIS